MAVVVAIISIFFYGYYKGSSVEKANTERVTIRFNMEIDNYRDQIDRLHADITNAQAQVKEVVLTKYVDRIKYVKEKSDGIQKSLKAVPSQSTLSNGWVYLHDQAASSNGGDASTARASDASPSGIKDNIALGTITDNYSTCFQNTQQLISLQEWVKMTRESINKQNENRHIKLPWGKEE